MSSPLSVLVTGSGPDALEQVRAQLAEADLRVDVRPSGNGHAHPPATGQPIPDVHVVVLGEAWAHELDTLACRNAAERPPMVAVGPDNDVRVLRKAMQAGARDYLSLPLSAGELLHCIRQIAEEAGRQGAGRTSLTAVINAKGGSGASFVATSLAHIFAGRMERRAALIDLDLQFGALHLCLDVKPRTSLQDALNAVDRLDGMALEGYMTRHISGLRLLASITDQLVLPWELSSTRLAELLTVAGDAYDQVVVDLPRQIDPLTSTVLERADRIYLVMQQSLIHVRDARRMLGILTRDLAVAPGQVRILVNRYDAKAPVSVKDITQALRIGEPILIPNDFRRVSDAINLGVPIMESAPSTPVARALTEVASLTVGVAKPRRGGLRNVLSGLMGQAKGSPL